LTCQFFSRFSTGIASFALLSLYSVSVGQTRTIYPHTRFTVSPVEITSTNSIQPQIQPDPPFSVGEIAAENDYTPPLPREPANLLKAGGLMSISRGTPKAYFPGPNDARWSPPDCNMAVGPNQIVCVINTSIAFFTKTGTKLLQTTMDGANGFFAGTAQTNFVFDPKCYYDPIAKRFFVVALDLDDAGGISNALIAVSDDDNPLGTWFKYRINTVLSTGGQTYWLDYPGFGFNKDAVVVTGNMFGLSAPGYFGVQALVIQKSALLTGGTAAVTTLLDPGVGTLMPTRTTDKNVDKIFGVAGGGGNAVRFYSFVNLTATPLMKEIDVPVPAYNGPGGVAPSAGSPGLDTLDGRIMTSNYRLGQVVAAHTIGLNGSHAVRWYDFVVGTWPTSGAPTVKQSGNITGTGASMHMPAININSFEDISVCYTRSSSGIAADFVMSARKKLDPLGQMGQPVKLLGSSGSGYGAYRWGDYFSNEIDPLDDGTFWGFGMTVAPGGGSATQVMKWVVTPPNSTGVEVAPDAATTFVGIDIIGGPAELSLSDDLYYQIGSVPIAQFGQLAGLDADYTIQPDMTNISIKVEAVAGVLGGTNTVWLWNWTLQRWDLIGSTPIIVSGNTQKVLAVRSADVPKYIGAAGAVKLRLRGHLPLKPFVNTMPNPFTYRVDLLKLLTR
jgi:hypothetical protein